MWVAAVLSLALVTSAAATDWLAYAGGPRRLFFNPLETSITPDATHCADACACAAF